MISGSGACAGSGSPGARAQRRGAPRLLHKADLTPFVLGASLLSSCPAPSPHPLWSPPLSPFPSYSPPPPPSGREPVFSFQREREREREGGRVLWEESKRLFLREGAELPTGRSAAPDIADPRHVPERSADREHSATRRKTQKEV